MGMFKKIGRFVKRTVKSPFAKKIGGFLTGVVPGGNLVGAGISLFGSAFGKKRSSFQTATASDQMTYAASTQQPNLLPLLLAAVGGYFLLKAK